VSRIGSAGCVCVKQLESLVRGRLVEVAGVTTSGRFAPCVGGPVRLTLLGEAPLPTGLIGATVRVRGVFGSLFTETRKLIGMRLLVSGVEDFVVDQRGPADWFALPERPVASLMQFEPERSAGEMVRVRGVVTATVPGRGVYLQDGDAGLWVESVEALPARPGDTAEVAGFVAPGDWNPVLQDAIVRVTGGATVPAALPVGVAQAMSGRFDLRRVQMEALLVEASVRGDEPSLLLQAGSRMFVTRLADANGLEKLKPNSWLRVTGICLNQRAQTRPGTANPRAAGVWPGEGGAECPR
jgi:hypothetical protein